MQYKVNITVTNDRGDTLATKSFRISQLDYILDTDLALIYAEAQQTELVKGLDIEEPEESFQ